LGSLAEFLKVPSRKLDTDEHGGALTSAYIAYALRDVQVTWECYVELSRRYAKHQLTRTPIDRIKSEAGIGKAYLKEMGIRPCRLVQPDFPPEITNIIMQTYFGGRSEVHLRRLIAQVLYCDFLSMYLTVCTLMGLWRWVIARGVAFRDTTDETQSLLATITVQDFQCPKTWRNLATLVQLVPDGDILPVRAQYNGDSQYTIGLNTLTSDSPLWYTLADCINSKFQAGKVPKIQRALRFRPKEIQTGLRSILIAGNPEFRVDPSRDDFYKLLVELRSSIKRRSKSCTSREAPEFSSQEQALKILGNSTSYGIFMEINVEELNEPASALRYADDGTSGLITVDKAELPGSYFHPLLASLITAGARLMLGIAERLAIDAGLDWAFCDTDSMAFAKPLGVDDREFHQRVEGIRTWFNALNPFHGAGDLLKLEDANFARVDGKPGDRLSPLLIWAISAKRYALFNVDAAGKPILRKASAHGLGHLMKPYFDAEAPTSIPGPTAPLDDIGVDRWQYDVWYRIITAALNDNPDRASVLDLPNFHRAAASRYAATTPNLLRWFDTHNNKRDYAEQVRPFNFLTVFPPRRNFATDWNDVSETAKPRKRKSDNGSDIPRPVAPYNADPKLVAANCFDRLTGDPISIDRLKTYAEALSDYHLHPESKFLNGDYLDRGATERRHVHVSAIRAIGKEANRWEEQLHLGYDLEAQIDYGIGEDGIAAVRVRVCEAALVYGQRRLAGTAGVARERLRMFIAGKANLRAKTVTRLLSAISALATLTDDRRT
jgi:hypothetical protein